MIISKFYWNSQLKEAQEDNSSGVPLVIQDLDSGDSSPRPEDPHAHTLCCRGNGMVDIWHFVRFVQRKCKPKSYIFGVSAMPLLKSNFNRT